MDSERQMSGTPLYKNVIASCALALGTVFCAWAQPQPLDLNGSWEFAFAEGKTLEKAGGADFVATDRMSVPGCWDMQPKWLCKRGTGLYRRTFTLAEPVENAWIVVDGMGLRAQFAVDGKPAGGVQPFPWGRLEVPTGPLAAGTHTLFAALDNVLDRIFADPEMAGLTFWHFADARTYHRDGSNIRAKLLAENMAGLYDGYRRAKSVTTAVREGFARKAAGEQPAKGAGILLDRP